MNDKIFLDNSFVDNSLFAKFRRDMLRDDDLLYSAIQKKHYEDYAYDYDVTNGLESHQHNWDDFIEKSHNDMHRIKNHCKHTDCRFLTQENLSKILDTLQGEI